MRIFLLLSICLFGCDTISNEYESEKEEFGYLCSAYFEWPSDFDYADSGIVCPDGRMSRAVEIWWYKYNKKSCSENYYIDKRAWNRYGCSKVIPYDPTKKVPRI